MPQPSSLLRALPLSVATAPRADDEWAHGPLSSLSDGALVAAVAEAIATPKIDRDTSFLTHAPLELLARAGLLPQVRIEARDLARRRIAAIAVRYAQEGAEIETAPPRFPGVEQAFDALLEALPEGDVDRLDGAALFLAPRVPLSEWRRRLVGVIAPFLGAAAHAPILLAELPRLEGRMAGAGALFRAPLRAISLEREAKIEWPTRCAASPFPGNAGRELMRRLASADPVTSPSPYIAPTMRAVEANGFAERILCDVTAKIATADARRALLRIAAQSMLQDDPKSAPYGWTHALTMPLAVLASADVVANATPLVRVAATHALGFRSTLGKRSIDPDWSPLEPRREQLFNVAPGEAAASAFHAKDASRVEIWSMLATRAATHEDAHLAKYTLAAMDAAGADPDAERLYCAAAAYLGAWWDAHPGERFE